MRADGIGRSERPPVAQAAVRACSTKATPIQLRDGLGGPGHNRSGVACPRNRCSAALRPVSAGTASLDRKLHVLEHTSARRRTKKFFRKTSCSLVYLVDILSATFVDQSSSLYFFGFPLALVTGYFDSILRIFSKSASPRSISRS